LSNANDPLRQSRAERVCIVPTELNLDVADGYENNGVHPNAAGYQQIGRRLLLAEVAIGGMSHQQGDSVT
jgi:lysophospholipase L1-like esterase